MLKYLQYTPTTHFYQSDSCLLSRESLGKGRGEIEENTGTLGCSTCNVRPEAALLPARLIEKLESRGFDFIHVIP